MRFRNFTGWAALSLTLAAPAAAQSAVPAVWYRASEACPDGGQFLAKLAENARQARLAQAGDHIDFVVTLVADHNETVGRLERQTDSGVVAIRELRDATCGQVADALALSLGLALTPGSSNGAAAVTNPEDVPVVAASVDVAASESVAASPPSAGAEGSPPAADSAAPAAVPPEPTRAWSVGIDLGAMIGITTHPLPRGELFLDVRPMFNHFLPDLSLRGSVVGSGGSSETAIGPVLRWILAARVEACPIAWAGERLDLRPCAGFELGADNASSDGQNGFDDRSLWAAPAGRVRVSLALLPRVVWLEAGGSVLIPLIRKEIFAGTQSLYRDAPAGFQAGLGVSLRLP